MTAPEEAGGADPGLPARVAALGLLGEVLRRRRPLDEALEAGATLAALAPRDRAFARRLAATVLRRLGQVDAVVRDCLERKDPPKAALQDLLRLGAAQLLFADIPAHAAVDTSVALAEAVGQGRYKGVVNAVLRRIARDGGALVARQDAGRLNCPDWLWLAWRKAYGTARTRAIVEAHLGEAPLDLTAKAEPESWAGLLDAVVLPTGTLRRAGGGMVSELPGFAEGAWWVQDAAAALPARLFGPLAGRHVFDLCAAPGGKTAQLAAAGARVTAVDRSAGRAARLQANLARLGLAAEIVVADAASWGAGEPADAVLLDAPCSATGTIRRHPDVERLKTAADVARLAAAQARLLDHAIGLVRPGGMLVYCVCSLQPEEGEHQIDRLLAEHAPVERVPVTAAEVGGLAELVNERGEVRTLPGQLAGRGGIDGFFIARLRRMP